MYDKEYTYIKGIGDIQGSYTGGIWDIPGINI